MNNFDRARGRNTTNWSRHEARGLGNLCETTAPQGSEVAGRMYKCPPFDMNRLVCEAVTRTERAQRIIMMMLGAVDGLAPTAEQCNQVEMLRHAQAMAIRKFIIVAEEDDDVAQGQ